ncbi:hypothetical protein, partial [Vreelandella aquamarina]|uniref:hypothetical protein n=1 Tax=Vreelandella aquamarina TaxID=77097 RepID=UPI0019685F3A
EGNKSGSNLAQGSNEFERCEHLSCALALIIGDLSPSSASAHMNYLIKLLKSFSKGAAVRCGAYFTHLNQRVNTFFRISTLTEKASHKDLTFDPAQPSRVGPFLS